MENDIVGIEFIFDFVESFANVFDRTLQLLFLFVNEVG